MVDYVKIHIKAGNGGNGHVAFKRLKGKPYGPPDGGNGGDGGNVFIKASTNQSTLLLYRFKKDFKAEDGHNGGKSLKQGAKGEDLILEVPQGTLLKDETSETIIDLTNNNQKELVALGGKGGRGNAHIKRSDASGDKEKLKEMLKKAETGGEGEEIKITLELKLLADAGLIGLPNSGKSTLLSKLTKAKPKIAPYQFTTLEPNLGVMYHKDKEIVIADIPGLIEGAAKGKGLGDQFLRHVERTRLLLHLVSGDTLDPLQDIAIVKNEIAEYSKRVGEREEVLADKPEVIILSKIDTLNPTELKNKIDQIKNKHIEVHPISSMTGEGLEELKDELVKLV